MPETILSNEKIMKAKHFALILLLLISSVSFAQETGFNQAQRDAIDAAVEKQLKQQDLVGVSIGVISQGEIAYLQAYGFEDREQQIPAATRTMFRWASISKPLTAVAAMQLVEADKLSLDDDVRKYVPEFPDKGHIVTVRDLMCHQSGIVHYSNGRVIRSQVDYDVEHPFEDVVLALDKFRESPLVHAPGERYSYSTHAYILLSAVVQRAGGKKFADQVAERISKPLKMTTLQPDYQWTDIPHRSVGYRKQGQGAPKVSTNTDVSWKLGGGGFISSVEDMAKFAEGLIAGELLNEESYRTMWKAQSLANGKATNVGLGFFVETQNGQLKISHNGAQEKTRTRMVIYPESKSAVVVMTNTEHGEPGRISTAIYGALNR